VIAFSTTIAMVDMLSVTATGRFGRALRYPLRFIPRGWNVPILQGPLRGSKWIVGSQRHAFWLGCYEPHVQRLFVREIQRGGVFYDVGANAGFYSLLASVLIDPGKVLAFEPLPANVSYLRQHLDLNRRTNVAVLEMAICDQKGEAFFEEEETRSMGRLSQQGSLRVRTSSLDSLLQASEIPPPDYIKMDIEGTELRALRGARKCFLKHRPVLFLATHEKDIHEECCKLLSSWRYEIEVVGDQTSDRAELLAKPYETI
jgi:FkbM family methyltransferase